MLQVVFKEEEKATVIYYIHDYCPSLEYNDNAFVICTDDD